MEVLVMSSKLLGACEATRHRWLGWQCYSSITAARVWVFLAHSRRPCNYSVSFCYGRWLRNSRL